MIDRTRLFQQMRDTLAATYPEWGRAKLFASDAGLNLSAVDPNGAPVVLWQSILDEAEHQGKVDALLAEALREAPAIARFATLREEYRQRDGYHNRTVTDRLPPQAISRPGVLAAPKEPPTEWDVFISHAWEDKEAIARPLAKALEANGLRVWFDEFTLSVGDRLRRSIDQGLARCKYGIVILSPRFFAKEWPQKELDGLVQRENKGEKVILPVWHNLGAEQIAAYSPSLADRIGVRSDAGLERVVAELLRAMRYAPPAPDVLTITSPIHLELVRIPAGEFIMGSDREIDKDADASEQPQHRLYLPELYIGKYPVTEALFVAFVKATGYKTTAEKEGSGYSWTGSKWQDIKGANWRQPRGPGSDVREKADHPVSQMSWLDAQAFCEWASTVTRRQVQVPSEAEWEKAARGTDGRLYPWGNEPPTDRLCNFSMNVMDTTPVGHNSPGSDSPYGCADMAGNIWEWTRSLWGENWDKAKYGYPYQMSDGRENTIAGTEVLRVLRGGAFFDFARYVRCAVRDGYVPSLRNNDLGFRVIASPSHS